MFYSKCFLTKKGPLGAIWVAAYCFKKLKKSQVTQTDISSSVDKILQDEFDVVTYRVLAYLLLGIVRIFSKKVEYLFDDCNKVLLKIKDFVVSTNERAILRAPYFSITLPERFELDAFDLEILEDTCGGNMMPNEDITLKDGTWKTGAIVPYSLDKNQIEELTADQDIYSTYHILNEDSLSSYLIDFDMAVGTSHNLSISEATIDKLQENRSNQHESMDLEMVTGVEEEHLDPGLLFDEDHHNKAADTWAVVVDSDDMQAAPSMQELWDNSIFQEAGLNLHILGEFEGEPVNIAKSFGGLDETDPEQIKVPDIMQSESEKYEVIKEGRNINNLEVSVEKLRENAAQEESRDVEVLFMFEDPPEKSRSIDDKHQSNTEHQMLLELDEQPENTTRLGEKDQSNTEHTTLLETTTPGNSMYKDHPLSITIDTTPRSTFPQASGVNTPEIMVIPTPAAKEGARVSRKRKCLLDDLIVFPNNLIKQFIEDSSDLVSKRRKAPHTALAAWRACQVSRLPWCFLDSLIPCSSMDLRSILCGKKLKISESVDIVKDTQTFTSKYPTVDRLVETVEPSEQLDRTKLCVDSQLVDTGASLEKVNVSASPDLGTLGDTVGPPEMLIAPESPTVVQSSEQVAIAPETPVLHTKSLRSFESPERPEISNSDRLRLESERLGKEPSPNKEHELDFSMMNEEINSCEGDNQSEYGWSERTRVAMRCLHRNFLNQKKIIEEEVVNLLRLLHGRTKKESARFFYEILVLRSKGYVHVKQEDAYGDILIWKTSQWGQESGEDSIEAAW